MENNINQLCREIKSRIDCKDYAKLCGKVLKRTGKTFRSTSVEGGSNETCLTIYDDNTGYFNDWKANRGGDVIDLCAVMNHNGDKGAAIKELMGITGLTGFNDLGGKLKSLRSLSEKITYWHKELTENSSVLEYLHRRLGQKTDQTVDDLLLGYDPSQGRLVIPYFQNGQATYYCTRRNPERDNGAGSNDPKYKKAPTGIYGAQPCWGLDSLNRKTPLIIAEGAFDAITFYQEGYSVLSALTGTFSNEQKKELLSAARKYKERGQDIIIIFDNDIRTEPGKPSPGERFTEGMAWYLFENGIPFRVATTPGAKDVSEYYETNGYQVDGILRTAYDGIRYLALSFNGKQRAFEDFIKEASRNTDRLTLEMFFEYVKDEKLFDPKLIKALERYSKKAPPQAVIRDEVIASHDLLFFEKEGFFEYDGSVWVKVADRKVDRYIDNALGRNYATGQAQYGIQKLIEAQTHCDQELNKNRLMVFSNGTLELDTGKFRNSLPDDLMSIRLDYEYNPRAECRKWTEYVRTVMSGDPGKITLLQEIAGYCFFPENTLQKCAYLKGKGGNGKSLFLETLQKMFNLENVSNISIGSLADHFSRIHLKDKLLNISHEESGEKLSKASLAEFKKVTAGDVMNGCYKGKDYINFRPHAKYLVSANNLLRLAGVDPALERRLIFVEFKEKFTDNPKEGEHQRDTELAKKLEKELPGIFNWAYEGYKRLNKSKAFSLTKEHYEMMEEFKNQNDSIFSYVSYLVNSEYFYQIDQITVDDAFSAGFQSAGLYSLLSYESYMEEERRKPVSKEKFRRNFFDYFLAYVRDMDGEIWERARTGQSRCVRRTKGGLEQDESALILDDPDFTPVTDESDW